MRRRLILSGVGATDLSQKINKKKRTPRSQEMNQALYSIVVPVFKSERSLPELYERINKTFENIEGDYELILVEDCGGDDTWQVMKSLRKCDKRVKIIRLARNFGQHNALMCGFSFASGDYVITMDDDLQNPPEEIPKLIKSIQISDADVVSGIPKAKKQGLIRNMGSIIYLRLLSLIFRKIPKLGIGNFRVIRKHIVDQILQIPTPNPVVGLLILKVTARIDTVTVDHRARVHGKGTYSKAKLVKHFMNGILYHSTLPLKMVFLLGITTLFFAVILSIYYFVLFLVGRITVPGWITIVLLLLFFSGISMFSVGIIGEYLLRIIQEVSSTPQYIIRDKEV